MSSLGTFVLLASFAIACYAAVVSVAGARRRSWRLVESGVGAFYLTAALLTLATTLIVLAFVSDDFSIRYVSLNSDTVQPLFYKITGYWGGLDGSILFWAFLLSVFGAIAVRVNRESYRELIPYVVAVVAVVEMFFIFLMVVHNNPFGTFLLDVPKEGQGMNPVLQTPLMTIHPPSLYTGFVGMTIPYAFGMAALITGHLDESWLRAVRRWTMIGWLFLSFGLTLGMIWAYEELGWGGYWAWDPVENAGLLPWFTATAFLHSVMVQERRGMLKVWNVVLVIMTFLLTIFGTFLTRSGVVQSVHAFGEDKELAWMFTAFMTAAAAFSFGLVVYRLPLLRARNELDSWMSREAAFLANNWILLFSALFVLFASMFPTLSEALRGERLTVGPTFYNKWMLPIGLILLALTGIGPMLAWRKSTFANLREQFLWPLSITFVTTGALVALGVRVWSAGLCFALSTFVTMTIAQEFWRGMRVRREATGTDAFTALIGLVARSRRRYGGYVVHVGIVLIFLGFAGDAFKKEDQVLLKPGETATLKDYEVKYSGLRLTEDGQKQMVTARVAVTRGGRLLDDMTPAKWFYRKHEDQPTTEVSIHRGFAEDFYVVLAGFDVETQSATLHIVINPLVNWIWLGFGVLALGTGIALLPERAFAFATARMPASVGASAGATTTLVILLLATGMALAPASVFAQQPAHMEGASSAYLVPQSELERQLQKEIVCLCGGCGRQRLNECTCGIAAGMRKELAQLVAAGKTREEVYKYFMDKAGSQEPLAMPIDKGFNRLAWAVPYAVGSVGAAAALMLAVRWSRTKASDAGVAAGATRPAGVEAGGAPRADAASVATPVDPALENRLADELRDLD